MAKAQPAPQPTELPLPQEGGTYIRNEDGSLTLVEETEIKESDNGTVNES